MKTLLTAILLMVSINCYSQFSLKTGIGMGVQVYPDYSYNLFQTTLDVTPQYTIDKLGIGAVVQSFISDSVTTGYVGLNASYPVWVKENKTLLLTGQYLKGDRGKQLIGGSLEYVTDQVGIEINASQEYKSKTGIFWLGLSYYLIR
ncbi:MAG TPA: hypothetical protein PL089_15370 [Ignavibacteria bacterium]|nr:hypothetical protein [Ignavibacteria bacterium]